MRARGHTQEMTSVRTHNTLTFSEDVLLEEKEKHEAEHGSQSPEQPQELHEGGPGQSGCSTK